MINKQMVQFPLTYNDRIGGVIVGWGAHEMVADEAKKAGIKNALITTTGLKGTGIVDEIVGILRHHGISTTVYDKVSSNPRDTEVYEAAEVFKNAGCDGVVSVGGGSSHDTGKGVRALATNPGANLCDMAARVDPPWMEVIGRFKPNKIPQISVNTTAGTGAESTMGGAIIDTKNRAKMFCVVPNLAPSCALNDPALIRLMPANLIAWTGFDAFSHAFESYVCKLSSPLNQGAMIHVIKLIAENLREFTYNKMNYKACENICWASCSAGVALGFGGGVGIVHGLGHGLSVLYDIHHGLANAVVTLGIERYNQKCVPEKFAEMARAMGVDTTGMTKMEASDMWFCETERLLNDLGIKSGGLKEQFGIKKEDIPHIVKNQYENDFARQGNPRDFDFNESVQLLEEQL
ncbi:MAG: iron-containing alcohol dehydrogenase [Desulfatiglans sp.]|nr:iron-containing alcohol dehydrogenase [Desulfatiglans sp.]